MATVQHKSGTRAQIQAAASAGQLLPRQIYMISNEGNRIVSATSTTTFTEYLKLGEGGGGFEQHFMLMGA